jgi:putative restriction endonuclease
VEHATFKLAPGGADGLTPVKLRKGDLLDRIQDAVRLSGRRLLILRASHPFQLRILGESSADPAVDVDVYIWNCTHGGGNRAPDEYRLQVTGAALEARAGATPLLLGWHEDSRIFAAFDFYKHERQVSKSPSMQVKIGRMQEASRHGIAAQVKENEIVVAVRPDFFVEYASNRDKLHKSVGSGRAAATATEDFAAKLSNVPALSDAEINTVSDAERREVLVTMRKKYRASDFRDRVLTAYGHECAMCGTQLGLVEAAHILPVEAPGSTDGTNNGVALCSLHHTAFDVSLVSFDERFRIEISAAVIAELTSKRLHGGEAHFRAGLRANLQVPAPLADRPLAKFVRESRKLKGWH